MRSHRRPRLGLLLTLLIPLALVLGIWLGGHPSTLPSFARDALVADSEGRLYEETLDIIERDYFRRIDRDKLLDTSAACKRQFCAKNGSDSRCGTGQVTVTPPANCDADALKEKGMENINMGQHAAALAQFEASLKCRRDSYVLQLAFMEACSSSNPAKAKFYYKQLTPAQQQKFAQICIRQKVEYQ